MAKLTKARINLLAAIVNATNNGDLFYVSESEGKPLLEHSPTLIEVNTSMTDPNDHSKVAARATAEGQEYAAKKKPKASNTEASEGSGYEIISGAVLPPSRRGNRGGGAPTQYPFDKLEVGQTFFVPVSEKHPNPVKTLGSTVSSANHRYAEETGETEVKERTKRGPGNKAVIENGQKVKEKVSVPVLRFTRRFTIRAVEAGKQYGDWTAPADGALIGRAE